MLNFEHISYPRVTACRNTLLLHMLSDLSKLSFTHSVFCAVLFQALLSGPAELLWGIWTIGQFGNMLPPTKPECNRFEIWIVWNLNTTQMTELTLELTLSTAQSGFCVYLNVFMKSQNLPQRWLCLKKKKTFQAWSSSVLYTHCEKNWQYLCFWNSWPQYLKYKHQNTQNYWLFLKIAWW